MKIRLLAVAGAVAATELIMTIAQFAAGILIGSCLSQRPGQSMKLNGPDKTPLPVLRHAYFGLYRMAIVLGNGRMFAS